jgi:hypothetical protein
MKSELPIFTFLGKNGIVGAVIGGVFAVLGYVVIYLMVNREVFSLTNLAIDSVLIGMFGGIASALMMAMFAPENEVNSKKAGPIIQPK